MNCVFHSTNAATARCASCKRGLCTACDHRIKGTPYCQECIVAGIESLHHNLNSGNNSVSSSVEARIGERHSPLIAGLFALIPGLGAAYNGQNIKSLLHFIIPVSLWQLGDIFSRGLDLPFFLGGGAFYLFSIYDAVRTARCARAGVDLSREDDALKQILRQHTTLWGALLVGVGLLTLVDFYFPYQLHRFWPVLLILAGLYLLHYFQRAEQPIRPAPQFSTAAPMPLHNFQAQPPSVISAPYERAEGNLVNAERRFDQSR